MECDRYPEHGQGVSTSQAWAFGVKRKLGGGLRLGSAGARGAGAALLPRGATGRPAPPRPSARAPPPRVVSDAPFMNSMDEITFWIVTKRAPCLASLQNLHRASPAGARSASPDPEPKNKKRRLDAVDDTSEATERPDAFIKPSKPKCEIISSVSSDTLVSDVDFNIKNSSVQAKNKKQKNQRNSRTILHKKNKVITSTPIVNSNLRRSLRKARCSLNNNTHLNTSFELFNMTSANGNDHPTASKQEPRKYTEQSKSSNLACGDQNEKKHSQAIPKPNNGTMNGQFEDMSDVSGFTANYIKSTKMNSKAPRKLRAKPSRNLAKDIQKEEKSLIVSISKAVNTGEPKSTVLNCSTDSSQNIINLVTVAKDSKTSKVNKSTSLLKFMESKTRSKDVNTKKEVRPCPLNASFQSTSTTGSRYPIRHKTSTEVTTVDNSEKTIPSKLSSNQRRSAPNNRSSSKFAGPEHTENTDILSRTRSGRCLGHKHPENAVFVFSNSVEQVSSLVRVNVASPVQEEDNSKKKRLSTKCGRMRKSINKTGQSSRDSFREKSGFAACFSDSDDDKPLKPQKYLS